MDVAIALCVTIFGAFHVEFDFDVRLKALGGLVAWWEGNVLGGKEGEGEGYGLAGDGDGFGSIFLLRCERRAVS